MKLKHKYERKKFRCIPTDWYCREFHAKKDDPHPNLYQWRLYDKGKVVVTETCVNDKPEYSQKFHDAIDQRYFAMMSKYIDLHKEMTIRQIISEWRQKRKRIDPIKGWFTYEEIEENENP